MQHPDGFYSSLAKLQLDKIAAEEAHAAATAKAKQAEAERDRLAAAGAQKDAQAKAEADPKAAEQQRVNLAGAVPGGSTAKASNTGTNVAALTPAATSVDLTRSVQSELGRVGCFSGQADGNWNTASQRSLPQFNRYAGTKLDVKVASSDALDAVKAKPSRVCPLVCEHGFKAGGDKCTKIVCGDGYVLNDDNGCEKKRGKQPASTAKRDDGQQKQDRPAPQRPQAGATAAGYGGAAATGRASGAAVRSIAMTCCAARSSAAVISNSAAAEATEATPTRRSAAELHRLLAKA